MHDDKNLHLLINLFRQEMVERSKTKFNEIDALKKQLVEAERNLARYVEGQNLFKEDVSTEASSEEDKHSIEIKLEHIEKMVRGTRAEMKEFVMTKSTTGSSTCDVSSTASASTMTSTDSRHLLDDRVIQMVLVRNFTNTVFKAFFPLIFVILPS